MRRRQGVFALVVLCVVALGCAMPGMAQNTTALAGTVTDPQGLAVKGAKVTLTNAGTGVQHTTTADEGGRYSLVGLPPGEYKLAVDGGANFATYENPSVVLTVGQEATLDVPLALRGQQQSVTVTAETPHIETTKSDVSQTIEQRRINNLPINGRSYVNFTLTNSQTTRDVSPTIGPAPNSGLNIGGARARGSMVSVDGANAVDNSVNAIRSTLSQEGVQEFQLILSNYNAEYGQASGGVINIVTKSGTNDFHGDAFGFFRNKAFQARNPFSGEVNPTTGILEPVKQAYTRVQAGLTLGGALKKNRTFYFFSYEYTQREETGFSTIGGNAFNLVPVNLPVPGVPGGLTVQLDGSKGGQADLVNSLLASGNPQAIGLAVNYGVLMGSASSVAVNKLDYGAVAFGATGGFLNPGPGQQFPLPVSCPAGQPVNNGATCSAAGVYVAPLPASYVGLNGIRGNFPVSEKTSLWSGRLDHNWNNNNTSFVRVGVSPSYVTGIESTAQNQVFGQNAGSRTGSSQTHDFSVTAEHATTINNKDFNQFRFQYARRGLHFGFSPLPGGDQIGVNIPGYAYFGREPYSTVDRIERRYEFTDMVTLVRGTHTFKMGGDVNLVQLRSNKAQIFELDFGGVVNFGGLAASNFGLPDCFNPATGTGHTGGCATGEVVVPGTTGLQSYGLGLPTTYIQGIGSSNQPFDNIPFAFFFQDSWRVNRKLTLNYGVRYDVEISPLFAPFGGPNGINAAAEKSLGVVEGIPRDYNNVAPRFGIAWDPKGDGKTVIRAGYGLFYDHPLLAVAFNSVTADGGRSVQLLSAGGKASACGLLPGQGICGGALDTPANLNGASIFQGVLNADSVTPVFAPLTLAYLPDQQRFNPTDPASLFANQNYLTVGFPLPILPFTLPVAKNFVYGYAQQANLTVERQLSTSWKISGGYQWTRGLHLNRPVDINSTDPQLLTTNFQNCLAAGLGTAGCSTTPLGVTAPASTYSSDATHPCGVTVAAANILGFLTCPAGPFASLSGQPIGTPAVFNFFRPSGPNPAFATGVGLAAPQCVGNPNPFVCGFGVQQFLAGLAHYPVGTVPSPYNSVDAQLSSGNSYYNALTVNVTKRFSKGFEMLSSYTWSHSIDDSTDLQSPLEPQDGRFPRFERSNSVNDQRQRWVTSAIYQTPGSKSGDSFLKHFISGFTLAPIIDIASGRPYNVITGSDARLDLGASQARPSVTAAGAGQTTSSFIPGFAFTTATTCLTNSGTPFTVPAAGLPLPQITPFAGCDGSLGRNRFTTPFFAEIDLRIAKEIPLGERVRLDLIADAFNLFNHTNIAAVNQLCNPTAGATCFAGQPSAAYDARQWQFAMKVSW